MNKQHDQETEGRQEFPKRPIVFMFQPTHYEIVPPERLSEWEELMRQRVGIDVNPLQSRMRGTETWSLCGPGDWNWDDCDEI